MKTLHRLMATTCFGLAALGAAHASPMAEFDAVFNRCKAHYAGRVAGEVTVGDVAGTWTRRVGTNHKLDFTAQEGRRPEQSTATITIELTEQLASANTEADARRLGASSDSSGTRTLTQLEFGYQPYGGWVTRSAYVRAETKPRNAALWGPPSETRLDRSALLAANEFWRGCVQ